jgi:hypothetical protein
LIPHGLPGAGFGRRVGQRFAASANQGIFMPAWTHTATWDDAAKKAFRKEVWLFASSKVGTKGLDCADLSMSMLIDFASRKGLPVTFRDNDDVAYSSIKSEQDPSATFTNTKWSNKEEYVKVVTRRVGTKALDAKNLDPADKTPIEEGDLMIAFDGHLHHTALVFRAYAAGAAHPQEKDLGIPNFPGDAIAISQKDQWFYYRGTILEETDDRVTKISRTPDNDPHVDYLNYRSRKKGMAELILFGNATQLRKDGFKFRFYSDDVFK